MFEKNYRLNSFEGCCIDRLSWHDLPGVPMLRQNQFWMPMHFTGDSNLASSRRLQSALSHFFAFAVLRANFDANSSPSAPSIGLRRNCGCSRRSSFTMTRK